MIKREFYFEYDTRTKSWCVYHTVYKAGQALASYKSKEEAQKVADEKNKAKALLEKPKVSRKGVGEMKKIIKNSDDPVSKIVNNLNREAQKNVMKMFSVDGGKSDDKNE